MNKEDSLDIPNVAHITVKVKLDDLSARILEIFKMYPIKTFKASHIKTILEFEGLTIGYGLLTIRMTNLVNFGLLTVEKGSRVHKYKLASRSIELRGDGLSHVNFI